MIQRRCFLLFILILLISVGISPHPALADIAPPKPPAGSNLDPGTENTNVRMLTETVIIDVPSVSKYDTGQATITADFNMRNLGKTAEQMSVRFPLCSADNDMPFLDLQGNIYSFPPIANFSVWVDGKPPSVTRTEETFSELKDGQFIDRIIPCWANFPVAFPPDQDVNIKVQYIQEAEYGEFDHGTINFVTLRYVLFTGAGWKDTIGSADIIAHFPVDARDLSLTIKPEGGTISGKEVRWHFENFEPDVAVKDAVHRVQLTFLQPKYWYAVRDERANAAALPHDGETWGRLGKALKYAYSFEHRFFSKELYWESFDAYQKAVDLLPNDADWHYGFAGLACDNAVNYQFGEGFNRNSADYLEPYRICIDQLNQALKINPKHAKANELMEYIEGWGWIDRSGSEPVYRILTPANTAAPFLTRTPKPSATATQTATRRPTATVIPASATPTSVPTIVSASTAVPTLAPKPGAPSPCGAILLPLIVAIIIKLFQNSG